MQFLPIEQVVLVVTVSFLGVSVCNSAELVIAYHTYLSIYFFKLVQKKQGRCNNTKNYAV